MNINLSLWGAYPNTVSYDTDTGHGVISMHANQVERTTLKCTGLALRKHDGFIAVYALEAALIYQNKSMAVDLMSPNINIKWSRTLLGLANKFTLENSNVAIYKTIYPSVYVQPSTYLQFVLF